jgi:hypothetical protein
MRFLELCRFMHNFSTTMIRRTAGLREFPTEIGSACYFYINEQRENKQQQLSKGMGFL